MYIILSYVRLRLNRNSEKMKQVQIEILKKKKKNPHSKINKFTKSPRVRLAT